MVILFVFAPLFVLLFALPLLIRCEQTSWCALVLEDNIIIPPPNEVGGGGILDSPCPSVRPSVRLSVDDMVSGA